MCDPVPPPDRLPPSTERLEELPVFSADPWQMSFGERAALEGLLAQLRPRLALEIGTAEGGSLRCIAAYAERVISFDLGAPAHDVAALSNVDLRLGDSHELLPRELATLAVAGELVEFVLLDGDHSSLGVRRDMEDLLASDAVRRTVILTHDTINEEVRRGLEAVDYAACGKVRWLDLDFCPGYVAAAPPELYGQCWGGLGVVVVDDGGTFRGSSTVVRSPLVATPELVWPRARALREQAQQRSRPKQTAAELCAER